MHRPRRGTIRGPGGRILTVVSPRQAYAKQRAAMAKEMKRAEPEGFIDPLQPAQKQVQRTRDGDVIERMRLDLMGETFGGVFVEQPERANAAFVRPEDYMALGDAAEIAQLLEASGMVTPGAMAEGGGGGGPAALSQAARDYLAIVPKTPLWARQEEAISFMDRREEERPGDVGGGLVCDEMGFGKTLQCLVMILRSLQRRCAAVGNPFGQPTLIVLPKTLKATWRNEVRKHFPKGAFSILNLCEGEGTDMTVERITENYNLVFTTYPTVVMAYNALRKREKHAEAHQDGEMALDDEDADATGADGGGASQYELLFHVPWWRVVGDEGHTFANRRTTRFAAMQRLRSLNRWIITGTPILNDVSDACAALAFLGVPLDQLPDEQSVRSERVRGTLAAGRSEEKRTQLSFMRSNYEYLMAVRALMQGIMLRRRDPRDRYACKVMLSEFETSAERALYALYRDRFIAHCASIRSSKDGGDPNAVAAAAAPASVRRRKTTARMAHVAEEDAAQEDGEVVDEPAAKRARRGSSKKKRGPPAPSVADERGDGGGGGVRAVTVDILRLRQICVCPSVIEHLALPPHVLLENGYSRKKRDAVNTQERIAQFAGQGRVPSLSYLAACTVATHVIPATHFMETPQGAMEANPYVSWAYRTLGDATWNRWLPTRAAYERFVDTVQHVHKRVLPLVGTKVRTLMRYYRDEVPETDKYLIFSEWVAVLEDMQAAFVAAGFATFILTGKQSSAERENVLTRFAAHRSKCVLFLSLMVGSNGLNIPCASEISLADPWWNKQMMLQAIYRAVRPEQAKYVRVVNIIMAHTIEEDVSRMADEKHWIARVVLDTDPATLRLIEFMRASVDGRDTAPPSHPLPVLPPGSRDASGIDSNTTNESVLSAIARQILSSSAAALPGSSGGSGDGDGERRLVLQLVARAAEATAATL